MYYISRVYTVIAFMFSTEVPMGLFDIKGVCELLKPPTATVYSPSSTTQ